jgi:hypothetical protein
MSDQHDFFTDHYCLLRRDPAARRRLIDDPVAGLKEYFGSVPDGNYRVEIVPQEPDTITIVLPAPPAVGEPTAAVRRLTICDNIITYSTDPLCRGSRDRTGRAASQWFS